MTSKSITSGVGNRYGVVFPLSTTTGLPNVDSALTVGTLTQGTLVEGIKTFTPTSPAPQRTNHYGDDSVFAQDSLPPTEIESFNFTTAKTNLSLDAVLEGNKNPTIDGLSMRAGDTDKRGSEPLVLFGTYRQALDTTKGSATFGKLRQWNLKIFPSTRVSVQDQAFEQTNTVKTYEATPSKVSETPWHQDFDDTVWGNELATYIDITTNYQPRLYVGTGNGTITKFHLPHVPATTTSVHVWVDGTLQTLSAVSLSDPSFTLASAVGTNGQEIFVINETSAPGSS